MKIKLVLCILSAVASVLCTYPAFGYASSDASNASFLAKENIVLFQSDTARYRLDDRILRQEVIGMALKMKGISLPENYVCKKYFTDATKNDWVCRALELAADNGIISRANTKARPKDTITQSEALAILLKTGKIVLTEPRRVVQTDGTVWSLFQDLKTLGFNQWQADMLDSLPSCEVINHGDSCEDGALTNLAFSRFVPNISASRAQVFEFAALTLGFNGQDEFGAILDDLDILVNTVVLETPTTDTQKISPVALKALLTGEPIQTSAKNPEVALVIFSDFECPFCARFYREVVQPLMSETSSPIALIYKNYLLSNHSHAYEWAVESECIAKNLGDTAFFDYAHMRYADQDASVLTLFPGLTVAQRDACMLDEDISSRISLDQSLGTNTYKVMGTPTTLVINMKNGFYETVVGAQTKEVVEATIATVRDHQ